MLEVVAHHKDAHDIPNPMDAYALDMTRAREELRYEPVYTVEKGVEDYLQLKEELGHQYTSAWSAFEVKELV